MGERERKGLKKALSPVTGVNMRDRMGMLGLGSEGVIAW